MCGGQKSKLLVFTRDETILFFHPKFNNGFINFKFKQSFP